MTKSKNTKRALLTSVLSMLLCAAMLVGSTFAWFTDSVTSGKNRIVAGNIDVELMYKNAATATTGEDGWANAATAESVDPKFFVDKDGNEILWEPGVMAVTQFKVANVGSLALKYSLATLKADFNAMEGHDLSEVIKFAVVEGAQDYATRADVEAASLTFNNFTDFKAEGRLLPTAKATGTDPSEKTFTVVAYWAPTSNDNLYNVNNGQKADDDKDHLYIDIEISLYATQVEYENDSFDKDYDKDLPLTWAATPEELNSAIADGGSVMVMSNLDAGSDLGFEIKDDTVINGNGNVLTTSTRGESGTQSRVLDMYKLSNKTLTVSDAVIGGNGENSYPDRGISLAENTNPVLNVENSTVQAKAFGVCLASGNTNPKVNIHNSTVKTESYTVTINPNIPNPKINIEGSTIEGYTAFQTYSGGVTGTFKNSTFKGVNKWSAEGNNNFAVIVVNNLATEAGTNLTFDNCTISAEEQSTATEYFFSLRQSCTLNLNGCTFVKNGETVSTEDIITDIQTGAGEYVQLYPEIDVTIFVDGVQIKPAA